MLKKEKIENLLQEVKKNTDYFLGYPVSKDFDYSDLFDFFNYPLNNLGDPFMESTYKVSTIEMEREVVSFFAKLFRAPDKAWWGYVTNGGSEGNLYSLYLAREKHPNGIVYHSETTHYSIQKNLHLLNIDNIVIKSQPNGEINYEDLKQTISMHRNQPVIIVANIGTTMTEGVDNLEKIQSVLADLAIQHYYIHCDAALGGIINAFAEPRPAFDFVDGADSISISGHKFIGAPMPCGIVIVKKINRDRIALSVSYTGSLDTTITGSRNGHSPLFLWYAIKTMGMRGLKSRVKKSLAIAEYALKKFKENNIQAWKNPNAITVVIPEQEKCIQTKWQLATENKQSHIICMPNVSKEQIDELIIDIVGKSL